MRAVNEDALLAYPPVFLVADGMGGHEAGDVASRLAVEEFARLVGSPTVTADDVHSCFTRTAARIRELFERREGGTTVAGVAMVEQDDGPYWLVFNVGDSRVYRWADGTLDQVSVDHSVVQELVDTGALDARDVDAHPDRHVLTRALGTGTEPEPDYWLLPAGREDRLMVCSDGVTNELTDEEIAAVLGRCADPQVAAQTLVELAVDAGGRDNASAVVVDGALPSGGPDVNRTVPRRAPAPGEVAP
ncbi:PP2C family protein-serine/threonine phosphatase [Cellulomonas hominis]